MITATQGPGGALYGLHYHLRRGLEAGSGATHLLCRGDVALGLPQRMCQDRRVLSYVALLDGSQPAFDFCKLLQRPCRVNYKVRQY